MTSQVIERTVELNAVRIGIDLLSKSANAQDLCRRVAHSDFMDGACHGVAVYLLNQRSVLVEVASYGKGHEFSDIEITAWGETVLSRAIRSRKLATESADGSLLIALPIQHAEVITGVFMFSLDKTAATPDFSNELVTMLSALGGMFMENKGLSLRTPSGNAGNGMDDEPIAVQELTSRQVKIIKLIAEGMTNAEIAKVVLLSESTVRQETIRIFRILKCHSRSEAIVKAKATGIISETTDTAPPRNSLSSENGKTPRANALGVSGI